MKIAILTQPLHTNYGGLLQAYALQTTLKKLGHDATILDRHHSQPIFIRLLGRKIKNLFSKNLLKKNSIESLTFNPTLKQRNIVSRETKKFIDSYIQKTDILYSTLDLKKEALRQDFDAYIVGSDQVWRLHYSPCITNYFLDFIEGSPHKKRIAYAASFGLEHWHFKPKTTIKCKRLAYQFDAISVREDSAIELCHKYLDVDAVHVLDPTMLLDPDDYRALVMAEGEPESQGDLMTYVLDPSGEKSSIIQQVESVLGLKAFNVMPSRKLTRETQDRIEECVFPPVTRWLRSYLDAKFVIVDSFHGCVFAILFNIPFLAICNQQRGATRFISLLRQFNLTNRLIDPSIKLSDELLYAPIDWSRVNQQLSFLKGLSIDFLQTNLH